MPAEPALLWSAYVTLDKLPKYYSFLCHQVKDNNSTPDLRPSKGLNSSKHIKCWQWCLALAKPEGDPQQPGAQPAHHQKHFAPRVCVEKERWEARRNAHHTHICDRVVRDLLLCTHFPLKEKEKRKALAPSSVSVPWVLCREGLAMTNLISEVAWQPRT